MPTTPRESVVSVTDVECLTETSMGDVAASRAVTQATRSSKLPLIVIAAAVGVAGIIVAVVLATRGGGAKPAPPKPTVNQAEVDRHLSAAASRISDGRLVGAGSDSALDHLLAAKQLAPDDPQVKAQLSALAETFEKLGDGAAKANDLAEAAAHFQAALSAEPGRTAAKTKLEAVENRARNGGR